MILMHLKGVGEDGIYRCEIPDAINVTQTIYIGVYSASTGEWYIYTAVFVMDCQCVGNRALELSGQNTEKIVVLIFCMQE